MSIGERIELLITESRIKQKDIAERLHVTQTSVSRWISGERTPNAEALCAIANYFDVSVDWLLGRSEYRNYHGFISGDNALEYCQKAKEAAWSCWYKVTNYDVSEIPISKLAENVRAEAHFEREIIRWTYDIPRMIHDLAEQTEREGE